MGNDREKFKRTFDRLHASPDTISEVLKMTEENKIVPIRRKYISPRIAASVAAAVLFVASGSTAYAMDIGGIQRNIQMWIHGEQTNATFTVENGEYTLEYIDNEGNEKIQSGGGIAFEKDGTQRPMTEEELMNELDLIYGPEVEYEDDGTVWIYYMNQKMEITDKFGEDGYCFIQLEAGDKVQYVTVKYQDGYAYSPNKYIQPAEFEN